MKKFEPLFVTVQADGGEMFHLEAKITLDRKNFDYIYNISRKEHGSGFEGPGKNRTLLIGGKPKLMYHDKVVPNGRIPEYIIAKALQVARFIIRCIVFLFPFSHLPVFPGRLRRH